MITSDQQDLLQALAFLYLRHGQNRRALTLILLAARHAPDDIGVLRTLAYAFVANNAPEEALEVIERLEKLDFGQNADQMCRLLKARALLHAGRRIEAKAVFRQFVAMRRDRPLGADGFAGDVEAASDAAGPDDPLAAMADEPFIPVRKNLSGPSDAAGREAGTT